MWKNSKMYDIPGVHKIFGFLKSDSYAFFLILHASVNRTFEKSKNKRKLTLVCCASGGGEINEKRKYRYKDYRFLPVLLFRM
jgi:hypothetical protein